MKFVPGLIILSLFLILGALVVLIDSQYQQLSVMESELEISQESYITGLTSSYDTEVQACVQAVRQASPDNLKEFIEENCLTPINETRAAQLLRKWEQESVIVTDAQEFVE